MSDQDPTAPIDPADPVGAAPRAGEVPHENAVPSAGTVPSEGEVPSAGTVRHENAADAGTESASADPAAQTAADPSAPGAAAHAAPTQAFPPVPPVEPRRRVRTGPIVWGSLILAFCAFVVQVSLAPGTVDPAVWISGTVLGLGVLLLGVSAGILARNARERRRS